MRNASVGSQEHQLLLLSPRLDFLMSKKTFQQCDALSWVHLLTGICTATKKKTYQPANQIMSCLVLMFDSWVLRLKPGNQKKNPWNKCHTKGHQLQQKSKLLENTPSFFIYRMPPAFSTWFSNFHPKAGKQWSPPYKRYLSSLAKLF